MKRDEIPMMREVLEQALQIDARTTALLWSFSRILQQLCATHGLNAEEIRAALSPEKFQVDPNKPEQAQRIAPYLPLISETIANLRDQVLGANRVRH